MSLANLGHNRLESRHSAGCVHVKSPPPRHQIFQIAHARSSSLRAHCLLWATRNEEPSMAHLVKLDCLGRQMKPVVLP